MLIISNNFEKFRLNFGRCKNSNMTPLNQMRAIIYFQSYIHRNKIRHNTITLANIIKLPINNPVLATYSQLFLEGHLYKRTPMVPAFLYIFELTFYIKMDTSLRGTHSANPKGVCLRESRLYHMNLIWWLKLPFVLCSSAAKHLD